MAEAAFLHDRAVEPGAYEGFVRTGPVGTEPVGVHTPAEPAGTSGDRGWRPLASDPDVRILVRDLVPTASDILDGRQPAGIGISLLLEGGLTAAVADLALDQAVGADRAARGLAWNATRTSRFRHVPAPRRRLRQVAILLSPEALDRRVPVGGAVGRFRAKDLAKSDWRPTEHTVQLAERLLAIPATVAFPDSLHLESFVLGIVAEALSQIGGDQDPLFAAHGTSRDVRRAKRARDFIDAHIDEPITLERVAREAGMSISTLQRAFRGTTNMTAVEYLRRRRLDRARDLLRRGAIGIAAAARMAGYSNTANFSTAFKRQFGTPPSRCRT